MSALSSYRRSFIFPIHPKQVSSGQLKPPYGMKTFFPLEFSPLESSCKISGSVHPVDSGKENLDIRLYFTNNTLPMGATKWVPDMKITRTRRDGKDLLIKKQLYMEINIGPNRFLSNNFHLSSNQNQIDNEIEESKTLIIRKRSKVESDPQVNIQGLLWRVQKIVTESLSSIPTKWFIHPYRIDLISMSKQTHEFNLFVSSMLDRTESKLLERNSLRIYENTEERLYVYINKCSITLEELSLIYNLNPFIPSDDWIAIYLRDINLNRPPRFRDMNIKILGKRNRTLLKQFDNVSFTQEDDWVIALDD